MKILVNISAPQVPFDYDALLPEEITVKALRDMITEILQEHTSGKYRSCGSELICIKERKLLMQDPYRLEDYNLRTGEHIVIL